MAVLKMFEICKKNLARESRELVELKTSKFKLFRKMHFVTATSILFNSGYFQRLESISKNQNVTQVNNKRRSGVKKCSNSRFL